MATLSSSSTDDEVWAAYDDNASYEEDGSRAKANAFITACRILKRRLPISGSRAGQSISRESLDSESAAASRWIASNPSTSGGTSGDVRFGDLTYYRD